MKSVHIQTYSGPHFSTFGLNTDQNNSEYGHFLRSVLVGEYYSNEGTLNYLQKNPPDVKLANRKVGEEVNNLISPVSAHIFDEMSRSGLAL